MHHQLRNPNFYVVFIGDLLLMCCALTGAYLIRFEFELSENIGQILALLPIVLPVKTLVFILMHLYRGMFRYAGLSDMLTLFNATLISTFAVISIVFITCRFEGFSRAVFILDAGLTFVFIGGFRMAIRIILQKVEKERANGRRSFGLIRPINGKPTFILGAGNAGEKALREVEDNPSLHYRVVGFLDDDVHKIGRSIHGIPILGNIDSLEKHAKKYNVEDALIAVPSSTGTQMRRIVEVCKQSGLRYKTLPSLGELINGKVSIKALRDVNYKDLLRREPVKLDFKEIEAFIKNKRILVTGAGGSIGSELCRQIIRFLPERLIMLDVSESNLYDTEMELKHQVGFLKYTTVLGAVQDEALVDLTLKKYKPHAIFHAAAYKHVPLLETNPWQAVANNIVGCKVILEKAEEHKIGHFVLVSTDKAVRPTNVMGASKRVCELLMSAYSGNGTCSVAVRFGNVVGSIGSVVPLFRKQIAIGGPVTVTHPDITRFFMTIPEACQLILQAAILGKGKDIFILEMGTPIKIVDIARDLIRLSGKEPEKDIEIVFTGLREGEKLYEELMSEGEGILSTEHEKILILKSNDNWHGNGNQQLFREWLLTNIAELQIHSEAHNVTGIKAKLKELVPEYQPQESECVL